MTALKMDWQLIQGAYGDHISTYSGNPGRQTSYAALHARKFIDCKTKTRKLTDLVRCSANTATPASRLADSPLRRGTR